MPSLEAANVVMERCDLLARFTEEPGRITRRFATPALREAGEAVAGWMVEAGLSVRRDAIGNVIGRRLAGERTLLLGSHIDSVPNAGRYDGPLGVLVAIAAAQLAGELPCSVEVYAFADEEGARFGTGYLGSSVVAGRFDARDLVRADADGVTLADAVRSFGGDPDALDAARRAAGDLIGYCEVHIEQGPVLEQLGRPLGVVTGIAGQSSLSFEMTGAAGHAGTVPMKLRHDALAAAAELVLAAEAQARSVDGLVATVGRLHVEPGAANVIPGRVRLTLDVRHLDDRIRADAVARIVARATKIALARRVQPRWDASDTPAVACDPALSERLAAAAGGDVPRLASGAGHDAAMLANVCPVAMLFVRCADGVSHHPDESVAAHDVAAAIDAIVSLLRSLPASPTPTDKD